MDSEIVNAGALFRNSGLSRSEIAAISPNVTYGPLKVSNFQNKILHFIILSNTGDRDTYFFPARNDNVFVW